MTTLDTFPTMSLEDVQHVVQFILHYATGAEKGTKKCVCVCVCGGGGGGGGGGANSTTAQLHAAEGST